MAFAIKGIPNPYLIIPRTDAEASVGRACILTPDDIIVMVELLDQCVFPHTPDQERLLNKLRALN